MMYGNYGYGWHMNPLGIFGGVLEFVFWVVIIVLLIKFLRHTFSKDGSGMYGGGHHGYQSGRALEALKERYAKGEIDKKEFEEKKKDLEA